MSQWTREPPNIIDAPDGEKTIGPDGSVWRVDFWGDTAAGPMWSVSRDGVRLQRPLDRLIVFSTMEVAKTAAEWCMQHLCDSKGCVRGWTPHRFDKRLRDVCVVCESSGLSDWPPGRTVFR